MQLPITALPDRYSGLMHPPRHWLTLRYSRSWSLLSGICKSIVAFFLYFKQRKVTKSSFLPEIKTKGYFIFTKINNFVRQPNKILAITSQGGL